MSVPTIAPYFPFRRIKIVDQIVSEDPCKAQIRIQPDKRFQPICHCCGQRAIRGAQLDRAQGAGFELGRHTGLDQNVTIAKCSVPIVIRVSVEDLELFHPYLRVTTRLARYIYQLCRMMTVTDVARHLGLDWKTVKDIDKYYLEQDYGQPELNGLSILAVDEISIRKGHRYLTVVLDYVSGRVLFVGKDRKAKTLERFFDQLRSNVDGIKAVDDGHVGSVHQGR